MTLKYKCFKDEEKLLRFVNYREITKKQIVQIQYFNMTTSSNGTYDLWWEEN